LSGPLLLRTISRSLHDLSGALEGISGGCFEAAPNRFQDTTLLRLPASDKVIQEIHQRRRWEGWPNESRRSRRIISTSVLTCWSRPSTQNLGAATRPCSTMCSIMKEIRSTSGEGMWITGHRFFYKAAHRAKADFHDSYSRYLQARQRYYQDRGPEIPWEYEDPELSEKSQRAV
jgi:hypothetical protein